ncbi:hypothetical protein OHV05_34620 [Kitasatospora sp. NBC_00070]|uniref:hypothetical protein n=1 Tax=Kitasatospora sp. NBC_00070 TaxID=2975962 RepID=UPI003254B510
MEIISGPGLRGRPWPELMPDHQPVLVFPADVGRPLVLEDGWAERGTTPALATGPHPGWSAVLDGYRLTVRRPGGPAWFDGEVAATREWSRSGRAYRTMLLITGPFTSVFDFQPTAAAGWLLLITPIRLTNGGVIPRGRHQADAKLLPDL